MTLDILIRVFFGQDWSAENDRVIALLDDYPDPHRFDPDRFLNWQLPPYSLITFGAGHRNCIGMGFSKLQMKILAVRVLQRYEWELLPGQSLETIAFPIRYPKGGLRVRFRARSS
mgnify:CR=1 FL=1